MEVLKMKFKILIRSIILFSIFLLAERLYANNETKRHTLQSYILTAKNKLYSAKYKKSAFMNAVTINKITNRSIKAALFRNIFGKTTYYFSHKPDYDVAQFWLDHGVTVDQVFKDNKLREAIYYRTCDGIKFWLKNGAYLANLKPDYCKNGFNDTEGSVWLETDEAGLTKLMIEQPKDMCVGTCADLGFPPFHGDSVKKILEILKIYGIDAIQIGNHSKMSVYCTTF